MRKGTVLRKSKLQRAVKKAKPRAALAQKRSSKKVSTAVVRRLPASKRIPSHAAVANKQIPPTTVPENRQKLSVIITVCKELDSLTHLLENVKQLQPLEIIVIENGATDQTIAENLDPRIKWISYPFGMGRDVGRAIGAREAVGDVLLFLDGDLLLTVSEMQQFVSACYRGVDVALNHVTVFYKHAGMIDAPSLVTSFLNQILRKQELGYATLYHTPFALTRHALSTIGANGLAVPPKALAIAAQASLTIQPVYAVDIFTRKIQPALSNSEREKQTQILLGDHAEAIHWIQTTFGSRGILHDLIRQRQILAQMLP